MSFLNRRPNPHAFNPSTSISSLTGRIILVTGANAGIGLETVLQLSLHKPSRIYLACRSKAKYDSALAEILKSNPSAKECVEFLELDLNSFDSVKAAAKKVLEESDRLDLLINNAGIMGVPPALTKEGYEIHFGVNTVGHALLTALLLPLLKRTAARGDTEKGSVRVVNVSSMGHTLAPKLKGDALIDLSDATLKSDGKSMHPFMHYGISKLGNILFAKEAARRWGESGVVSVSVHPGRVQTNIAQDFLKSKTWDLWAIIQKTYDHIIGPMSVEEGALTQLWTATTTISVVEKGSLVNGGFYIPVGVRGDEGDKRLNNEKAAGALWEWMVKEFKKHGVDM